MLETDCSAHHQAPRNTALILQALGSSYAGDPKGGLSYPAPRLAVGSNGAFGRGVSYLREALAGAVGAGNGIADGAGYPTSIRVVEGAHGGGA